MSLDELIRLSLNKAAEATEMTPEQQSDLLDRIMSKFQPGDTSK